jgi:hypothetical protein
VASDKARSGNGISAGGESSGVRSRGALELWKFGGRCLVGGGHSCSGRASRALFGLNSGAEDVLLSGMLACCPIARQQNCSLLSKRTKVAAVAEMTGWRLVIGDLAGGAGCK